MLSADHPYRLPGGQATRSPTPAERRRKENETIRRLSEAYPELISFEAATGHSNKRMQYKFTKVGPGPMRLEEPNARDMSNAVRALLKVASGAVRMRKIRRTIRARSATAKRKRTSQSPTNDIPKKRAARGQT